jgi:CheY-like chemotaxis protein
MATILVIDDSPTILATTAHILEQSGYRVITSCDGKTAIESLRTAPVDVIVTDIYMPGNDGLEVLRDVRRIAPQIPVVAMSGVTGKGCMLHIAKYLGACASLAKPFSPAQLLEAVAAAQACSSGLSADPGDAGGVHP